MNLTTAEKFLLIAHHPEKGRFIIQEIQLKMGLMGALLLDLTLDQKIVIENDRLILKDRGRSNDPVISEISALIRDSKKPRRIRYWIGRLARRGGKYKRAIMNGMAEKRLIRIEHKSFLGIIPYRKSYIADGRTWKELIRATKNNVLHHDDLSDENVVLLGLIEACKMHRILASDREELKRIKTELKAIIKDSPIAQGVATTIREVQAAVVAAMVASTAATTSSH